MNRLHDIELSIYRFLKKQENYSKFQNCYIRVFSLNILKITIFKNPLNLFTLTFSSDLLHSCINATNVERSKSPGCLSVNSSLTNNQTGLVFIPWINEDWFPVYFLHTWHNFQIHVGSICVISVCLDKYCLPQ